VIKHILLVSAVIAGSVLWIRLGRIARTDLDTPSDD